jgi:hypothetical protein
MKKVLMAIVLLFVFTTPALAWVVVADPYIPAADGSVGIPTSFVYRLDNGSEQTVVAVNPASFPAYFTAPTGGWPTGCAAFVLDVSTLRGNHSLVVKAANAEGESAYSSAFPFSVPVRPANPGALRLVK